MPALRENMVEEEIPSEEVLEPLDLGGPPPPDDRELLAQPGVSDMGPPPEAPAGAPFNPNNSTFDERQKNMTAQERADWASQRWGKPSPPLSEEVGAAPYGKPKGAGQDIEHNRRAFEETVFNQIGGNPFEIDVMKTVDEASAKDLPYLFQKVFGNQLIWQDRHRMDPKQRQFWDSEVKKYRGFLKESIESEKKVKTDLYNRLMTRFDNERKEEEAAIKRVQETEAKAREKFEKSEEKRIKTADSARKQLGSLEKEELQLVKDMATIIKKAQETPGQQVSKEEELVLNQIGQRLRSVRGEAHSIKMKFDPAYKRKFEEGQQAEAAAADTTKRAEKEVSPEQKTKAKGEGEGDKNVAEVGGFKVILGPKGKPVEVLRLKDGRLAAEYPDGTRAIIREATQ